MGDLISRRAAIDAVSRGCQEFRGIFAECEENLNELPSAQPEPNTIYSDGFCDGYKQGIKDAQSKIVCCKDCKYFETDYWVNSILTHEICAICECAVKPDGYCFMAERREE